jgi:formamidopyrimidine-DNA glycosylase
MIAGRLHWRLPAATLGNRNDLAAFDFPGGTLVLTEAGSKRRAPLHVVAGEPPLLAINPGGIDVFAADLTSFRRALSAENQTLKRALTDPHLLSGFGNAYSDEILHAAQLSPLALTHKVTAEQWDRLFAATRSTLQLWVDRVCDEAKHAFPIKVTAFRKEMAVHGKFGKPCPRCGALQPGGKLLSDRSLSRLLRADAPRTLDDLKKR